MDRNTQRRDFKRLGLLVALRKESVDRNTFWEVLYLDRWVALRKESVDRNSEINARGRVKMKSLSARRAWIEIIWVLQS